MKKIVLMASMIFSLGGCVAVNHSAKIDSQKTFFKNQSPIGGIDVSQIYIPSKEVDDGSKFTDEFVKAKGGKDVYESIAQYQARIASIQKNTSFFVSEIYDFNLKYDAEKSTFILDQYVNNNDAVKNGFPAEFDLKYTYTDAGSYEAKNFFGSDVMVTKRDIVGRNLYVISDNYNESKFITLKMYGELKVVPESAKELRKSLRVLYVGKVDVARVTFEKYRIEPKLPEKVDAMRTNFKIPLILQGLYLYDISTNKILAPLTIKQR